jgi:hypothetical protein
MKSVHFTRAFLQRGQLEEAIRAIEPSLGPDVLRLRYSIGEDWTGDPAIFFRVLLSDRASRRDQLLQAINRIKSTIEDHLDPLAQWGVLPYYSFRSQSEQEALKEEAWA